MVKFSKELEAQLIPEWKDAFVNYWALKKNVKKIKLLRESASVNAARGGSGGYGGGVLSFLNPLRRVGINIADKLFRKGQVDGDVLQVGGGDQEHWYETDPETLFTEDDAVKKFFVQLDQQLNKVNQFYTAKEAEFLERGEILNKQLDILLNLKRVLHERYRKLCSSKIDCGMSPSLRGAEFTENGTEGDDTSGESPMVAVERMMGPAGRAKVKPGSKGGKLNKAVSPGGMRIEIPAATPTRALSVLTQALWEDVVSTSKRDGSGEALNRKKVQCAEKMIRGAYIELYRGLGLLKTYSSLNLVAFTKILKKFDKVSSRQASATYLKAVKRSDFLSSDKAVRLADEVECMFIRHFASNDRKRAMKFLRPQSQKDSHMITFLVGKRVQGRNISSPSSSSSSSS